MDPPPVPGSNRPPLRDEVVTRILGTDWGDEPTGKGQRSLNDHVNTQQDSTPGRLCGQNSSVDDVVGFK